MATNNVGDDAAKAVAAVLPQCPSLQWLGYVLACRFAARARAPLSRVSCNMAPRESPSLATNVIGDDGVKAGAAALPTCPSLKTLE